jgi:hypothetical protein
MLEEGTFVRIVGGAWRGCRGRVAVTATTGERGPVVVTVETTGEGRGWSDGVPILQYTQRYVARDFLVPLGRSDR